MRSGAPLKTAGEGAKALADKQREIMEAAFKETSAMVGGFHRVGDPQEHAHQTKGLRETSPRAHDAEHTRRRRAGQEDDDRRDGDRRDRLRESLTELRDSVGRAGSEEKQADTRATALGLEAHLRPAPRREPHFGVDRCNRLARSKDRRLGRRRTKWTTRWPIGLPQKEEKCILAREW